jgi:hypothetical protein
MGEGFSNPIVGGNAVLIRPAIQSPNFVAGSTGWIIRADGTAEFSGVVMRGDLHIQANIGVGIVHGIFFDDGVTHVTQPYLAEGQPGLGTVWTLDLAGPDDGNGAQSGLEIWGDTSTVGSSRLVLGGGSGGVVSGDVMWGAQPHQPGGQYYEVIRRNAALSLISGQTDIVYDTRIRLDGLYPTAFNTATGVWTCPKDGYYHITAHLKAAVAVANARSIFSLINVAATQIWASDERNLNLVAGANQRFSLSVMRDFVAGDTVKATYFQGSGAAIAMDVVTNELRHIQFKRIL